MKRLNRVHILVVALALTLAPGCNTIAQATRLATKGPNMGPAVFGGVRHVWCMTPSSRDFKKDTGSSIFAVVLLIIDLPLSLAADAVLLPFSIPWELYLGGIDVRKTGPMRSH